MSNRIRADQLMVVAGLAFATGVSAAILFTLAPASAASHSREPMDQQPSRPALPKVGRPSASEKPVLATSTPATLPDYGRVVLRVDPPGDADQPPATSSPAQPNGTATPASTPRDKRPPEALLSLNGREHVMMLGTYCWIECADTFGPMTSRSPLRLASRNVLVRLTLRTALTPTKATLWVIPVRYADAVESGDDWVKWPWPGAEGLNVLPGAARYVRLTLAPGLNVLNVGAKWGRTGDADYGLLVEAPGSVFLPLTVDRDSLRLPGFPRRWSYFPTRQSDDE